MKKVIFINCSLYKTLLICFMFTKTTLLDLQAIRNVHTIKRVIALTNCFYKQLMNWQDLSTKVAIIKVQA